MTGFDTYGTSLQPAVFGDINSLSVREVDLHFVTEREVFSRGRAESWKDACMGVVGAVETEGRVVIFEVTRCLRLYSPPTKKSTCRA